MICAYDLVQRSFSREVYLACIFVAAVQGFHTLEMHRRRRLQLAASFGVISPLKKKQKKRRLTIPLSYLTEM